MIQIDMAMPKNCIDCPACNEYLTCAIPVNGRKWGENDVRDFSQGRPEWCPMKEQDNEKKRIMKVIWDTLHEGLSIDTVADQDWVYEQIRHKIEDT